MAKPQPSARGQRGFTLLEMIMAGLIMTVVAAFGLFSLSQGHKSTESRGLAEEIAEELKAARQEAISGQTAVAIVFPSNGGTTRCSQSVYQLEGISTPRVTRAIKFHESYPESCFYWGFWGGATAESLALSDSETEFDVDTWGPRPVPTDFALIFTPSGTVKSNGLPVFSNGEYRLLVSNGVVESGNAPVSLSKPYTVRVGKTGAVTCVPGVYGAVIPQSETAIPITAAANALPAPAAVSGVPEILTVRAEPTPVEESDQGAVTIVPEEGYITLVTEAVDPSGGPLTVEWNAENEDGEDNQGFFSSTDAMTMTWDPKWRQVTPPDPDDPDSVTTYGPIEPRWVARMNWTPPPEATHGDLFTLTCTVRNPRGQHHSMQMGSTASVEVVRPHKVACVNTDVNWERYYIAWLNPEGTNVVACTAPDLLWDQLTPVWAPNGTKLAFYQVKEVLTDVYEAQLYVVNDDGTGLNKMFTCRGAFADYNFGPSFSPDGSQVAFSSYEEEDSRAARVWRCDVFGSPSKQRLTNETAPAGQYTDHTDVSWNPVYKRFVLYTGTRKNEGTNAHEGSSIRVCDIEFPGGPNSRNLVMESGPSPANTIGESHWSFDGKKVVYTQGGRLFWFKFDPASGNIDGAPHDITPPIAGFHAAMPRFSPDDNQVAVVNDPNDEFHPDWGALYVIENLSDPSQYHRVTGGFGGIYGYNWSALGDEFVFSVMDNQFIYTVSAEEESTPKDVTPPGFNIMSTPSWWAP